MVRLVAETLAHHDAREALLDASFGPCRFEKTSERLREDRLPAQGLAFSAMDGSRLVGTLRLWNISAGPGRPSLLLGPLAVDEARRGEGLGSSLMLHGLLAAKRLGHRSVLLVGDAPYYARFGFSASHTSRLWMPGPFERERFLGLELAAGSLQGAAGLVSATGAFAARPDLAALVARVAPEFGFSRAA